MMLAQQERCSYTVNTSRPDVSEKNNAFHPVSIPPPFHTTHPVQLVPPTHDRSYCLPMLRQIHSTSESRTRPLPRHRTFSGFQLRNVRTCHTIGLTPHCLQLLELPPLSFFQYPDFLDGRGNGLLHTTANQGSQTHFYGDFTPLGLAIYLDDTGIRPASCTAKAFFEALQ